MPVKFSHLSIITSTYLGSNSIVKLFLPNLSQAIKVLPEPPNKSKILEPCLDEFFIYIVDDWNWPWVRDPTLKAILDNNIEIIYKKEIFVRWDLIVQIINYLSIEQYKDNEPIVEMTCGNPGEDIINLNSDKILDDEIERFYLNYYKS